MSYEIKDILKTMIDNNEPHWSADTMDMVRVELEHIYKQVAKASEYKVKANLWEINKKRFNEYEAKAKAFDEIMKVFENSFGDADSLAKLKVFKEVENAYIESGESE